MYKLKPHLSNSHTSFDIEANLSLSSQLVLEFKVKGKAFTKESRFSKTPFKNWGLWEEDVVELFIRREGESSYLEVQANPKGLGFQLQIFEPRKLFYTPIFESISVTSKISSDEWLGKIEIPQELIPGKGESFEGGIYAILGTPREYYALNPNIDLAPDYHRPELYIKFKI